MSYAGLKTTTVPYRSHKKVDEENNDYNIWQQQRQQQQQQQATAVFEGLLSSAESIQHTVLLRFGGERCVAISVNHLDGLAVRGRGRGLCGRGDWGGRGKRFVGRRGSPCGRVC